MKLPSKIYRIFAPIGSVVRGTVLAAFLLLMSVFQLSAQDVPYHISNFGVYDFLDEMANMKVIQINSAIKPFSRLYIATKLQEVQEVSEELNKRQQKELAFYLKDFNKELKEDKNFDKRRDLFYYKDSLFRLTINPVLGFDFFSNDSGSVFHRWGGARVFGNIGKNFGFYWTLIDNYENRSISTNNFYTQRQGANYKGNGIEEGDYSEMRGGINYSWKWGRIGVVKDHMVWGNNYNGANILSGRAPSFAQITLNLKPVKWLEFNYFHGWLVSVVVDSARSYYSGASDRLVMHQKFIASNMVSVTPTKNLVVSGGNSIVYSDELNPVYFIPFMFYKSVDHTYNNTGSNFIGQNAQMFLDISSRQIRKLHLYSTIFVDELALSRMFDKDQQTNFYSLKLGGRVNNFLVQNLALTAEFTRTNPGVYEHGVITTTFASNEYSMGHYLQDNSKDVYLAMSYRPVAKLLIRASYNQAEVGESFPITAAHGTSAFGLPYLESALWRSYTSTIKFQYQVYNDGYATLGYSIRAVSGPEAPLNTPAFYLGNTNTLSFGLNFGF